MRWTTDELYLGILILNITPKWNVVLSMRQFFRDHYILLIPQSWNESLGLRRSARLISSSVTSSRVQSIQRFCCQAFVSSAIKGSRASGQVGVYCRMIHPIVWCIKTNLHCSIGHWSFSFYVSGMSTFLRWCKH